MEEVLSMARQAERMRSAWPTLKQIIASSRLGIWRGVVTPLSQPYEIEILYALDNPGDPFVFGYPYFPRVRVLSPRLVRRSAAPDEAIPHIYDDEDEPDLPCLCLFNPYAGGWRKSQLIADTTVPWANSWLRFYEAWHATGIWHGGGVAHAVPGSVPVAAVDTLALADLGPSARRAGRRTSITALNLASFGRQRDERRRGASL